MAAQQSVKEYVTAQEAAEDGSDVIADLGAVPMTLHPRLFADLERAVSAQDMGALQAALAHWAAAGQAHATGVNPLAALAGSQAEDPFWDEVQAEIARARGEMEARHASAE